MESLKITETNENFDFWINQEFLSQNTREALSNKDVLIVPLLHFRDYEKPVFPVNTTEFFNYLKENLDKNYQIDICIEDSDYVELALHSNLKRLGTIVVKYVALPIVMSVVANYLYDLTKSGHLSETDDTVKFEIVVTKENGSSKSFSYEGPVNEIDSVKNQIIDLWNK